MRSSRSFLRIFTTFLLGAVVASCSDDSTTDPVVFSIPPIEFATPDSITGSNLSTMDLSDAQGRLDGANKVNQLWHTEIARFLRSSINDGFGDPGNTTDVRFFTTEIPGAADPSIDDVDHIDFELTLKRASASPHVFRGVMSYRGIKADGSPRSGTAISGAIEVQVDTDITTLSYALDGQVDGDATSWIKQTLEFTFAERSGAFLTDWYFDGPGCAGGWTQGSGSSYEFWEYESGQGATYAIVRNAGGFGILEDRTREDPPVTPVAYYQLTTAGADAGSEPDGTTQTRLNEINSLLTDSYVRTNLNRVFDQMTLDGPDMTELRQFHEENASW